MKLRAESKVSKYSPLITAGSAYLASDIGRKRGWATVETIVNINATGWDIMSCSFKYRRTYKKQHHSKQRHCGTVNGVREYKAEFYVLA